MARFDTFMAAGWETSNDVFGTVNFTFPGVAGNVPCDFNSLGYTQQVEVYGKVESFTATIEVAQARVQIGSAPIVVAPPTVNVQAPQIQGGTGGFGAMASSSVVDTEFMKLLVGRTVTL